MGNKKFYIISMALICFLIILCGHSAFKSRAREVDDYIIAQIVMAEAGNQPMIGKVAVAATVLNRCDYYGCSVYEIAEAKDQYSYPYLDKIDESAYRAAEIARENRDLFPETMMYFRTENYHSFGEPYMQIGDHYFSCLKEK